VRSKRIAFRIGLMLVLGLAGCSAQSTTSATTVAPVSTTAPIPTTTTPPIPTTTAPAPPAPNNPSTLEGVSPSPPKLLLQQLGSGSGVSNSFTPTGAITASQQGPSAMGMARLRVEWACAPGSSVTNVHLQDGSGDISGPLTNGFDGPIPVSSPPAKVVWEVQGACSWHVRAVDQ
jgi:hypothetical protein